jgi:ubiquinone/menaquinone biosynthesis C-methylase UbiE
MTSLAQRTMESRALPLIYERIWRPVAFTTAQFGRGTDRETRRIAELLALQPDAHVLDVACGPGNTTRRLLADLGPDGRVTGVDLAESMIRRARADTNDPRVDYRQADATALPFADGTFDAVTCLGALYLMPRPLEAIDEIARVVRPGGRIVILTSVHRGPRVLHPVVELAIAPAGGKMFGRRTITDRLRKNGLDPRPAEVAGVFQIASALKPV